MKTINLNLIILSLIINFSSALYAVDSGCQNDCQAVASGQAPCPVDANDPFSKETRLKDGPMKGHCIDPGKYRSVHRLTREERIQFGVDPNDDTVEAIANFSKDYKNWIAVIPKEKLQNTVFQLMRFNPKIPFYHGQVRFTVAKEGRPIKLIEQTKNANRKTEEYNDDIVYSLFAARPVEMDDGFDPIRGVKGYYASTYTVSALKDQADWTGESGVDLFQWGLDFGHDKTLKALTHGITRGTEHETNDPYNTATASCINAAFETVKFAGDISRNNPVGLFAESSDPKKALKDFGLVGPEESSRLSDYAYEKDFPLNADQVACPSDKEKCNVMKFFLNTYNKSAASERDDKITKQNLNDLMKQLDGCDINAHEYKTNGVTYTESKVIVRSSICRFLSEHEIHCKPQEDPIEFKENGYSYRVCKDRELLHIAREKAKKERIPASTKPVIKANVTK